jgi:hypothetical protein
MHSVDDVKSIFHRFSTHKFALELELCMFRLRVIRICLNNVIRIMQIIFTSEYGENYKKMGPTNQVCLCWPLEFSSLS